MKTACPNCFEMIDSCVVECPFCGFKYKAWIDRELKRTQKVEGQTSVVSKNDEMYDFSRCQRSENAKEGKWRKYFRNADAPLWLCWIELIGGLIVGNVGYILVVENGLDDILFKGVPSSLAFWLGGLVNLVCNVVAYCGLTCLISKVKPVFGCGKLWGKTCAVLCCIIFALGYATVRPMMSGHKIRSVWEVLFLMELCRGIWRAFVFSNDDTVAMFRGAKKAGTSNGCKIEKRDNTTMGKSAIACLIVILCGVICLFAFKFGKKQSAEDKHFFEIEYGVLRSCMGYKLTGVISLVDFKSEKVNDVYIYKNVVSLRDAQWPAVLQPFEQMEVAATPAGRVGAMICYKECENFEDIMLLSNKLIVWLQNEIGEADVDVREITDYSGCKVVCAIKFKNNAIITVGINFDINRVYLTVENFDTIIKKSEKHATRHEVLKKRADALKKKCNGDFSKLSDDELDELIELSESLTTGVSK